MVRILLLVVEGADALGADDMTTIPDINMGICVEQQQKSPSARKCGKKKVAVRRTLEARWFFLYWPFFQRKAGKKKFVVRMGLRWVQILPK